MHRLVFFFKMTGSLFTIIVAMMSFLLRSMSRLLFGLGTSSRRRDHSEITFSLSNTCDRVNRMSHPTALEQPKLAELLLKEHQGAQHLTLIIAKATAS